MFDSAVVRTDAGHLVGHIRVHEAHLAVAAERARVVEAVAVLTQAGVVCALVNVGAGPAVPAEAHVAHALQHQVKRPSVLSREFWGVRVKHNALGKTMRYIFTPVMPVEMPYFSWR